MNKIIEKMALTLLLALGFQAQAMFYYSDLDYWYPKIEEERLEKEKKERITHEEQEFKKKEQKRIEAEKQERQERIEKDKREQLRIQELNDEFLLAVRENNIEKVKQCLGNGADTETKDSTFTWTPLIFASLNGNFNIVKLLLQEGANIEATSDEGATAYTYTIQNSGFTRNNQQFEIANYLLGVQNEFTAFKNNPTKLTVTTSFNSIPKSAFIKMIYKNIKKNNVYFNDLMYIFTVFEKTSNNSEFKKLLKECNFLQYSKKKLREMRNNGFSLTTNEFDMKKDLSDHQTLGTFIDLIIE